MERKVSYVGIHRLFGLELMSFPHVLSGNPYSRAILDARLRHSGMTCLSKIEMSTLLGFRYSNIPCAACSAQLVSVAENRINKRVKTAATSVVPFSQRSRRTSGSPSRMYISITTRR